MQVAGLVFEFGGDIDQAIAGLLHDTVEDCDDVSITDIEDRFGTTVARIVDDLTDTLPGDTKAHKSPWHARKVRYLTRIESAGDDSRLVSACDKVHNLTGIVDGLRLGGSTALANFHGGPNDLLWFYGESLERLEAHLPEPLAIRFKALLDEARALIQSS